VLRSLVKIGKKKRFDLAYFSVERKISRSISNSYNKLMKFHMDYRTVSLNLDNQSSKESNGRMIPIDK
jgi:hypothetical protein